MIARRHAAGAGDRREQLVAVRDREHALAVGDVVDRAGDRRDARRARARPRARELGGSPAAPIDSTPRTSASRADERRDLARVAAQRR